VADLSAQAIVFESPKLSAVRQLELTSPGAGDVVVDIDYSGISTGTERLLWTGTMPPFPGLEYPLVPGYESVGRIVDAGPQSERRVGETVFVPGARCFGSIQGLFGGAASRLVVPGDRVVPIDSAFGDRGVLLALAATALNALRGADGEFCFPDLIVGHGVLGRLLARLVVSLGAEPPMVWEIDPRRASGNEGYPITEADKDPRRDYRCIIDVSGASGLLDALIERLTPGGEVVLAGFYNEPLHFAFPGAFMRRARIRVAAEWQNDDLETVAGMAADGKLSLDGLVTNRQPAQRAQSAYETAFADSDCLKMVLDWRNVHSTRSH
jgi:3-hydroxyethyl bacteriochlorophyllide a dehydrogenase